MCCGALRCGGQRGALWFGILYEEKPSSLSFSSRLVGFIWLRTELLNSARGGVVVMHDCTDIQHCG